MCDCTRMECPMENNCLPGNTVYQAIVTRLDTNKTYSYTGLTEPSFKGRWRCHDSSFNLISKRKETELSKCVWNLKEKGVPYSISWKRVGRAQGYNPTTKSCRLCLLEKYLIMFKPEGADLNKNSEFFTFCKHRAKLLICNS